MAARGYALALSVRLYGWLLAVYPPAFRREYGQAMLQLFRDCCRDAYSRAGVQGILAVWGHTLPDLARSGLRERLAESAERRNGLVPTVGRGDVSVNGKRWKRDLLGRVAPYPLAALFGLLVAYLNTHTDETPFVALPLFAAVFSLGFISPRGAWRWALLVGLWVPLSQVFARFVGMRLPYSNEVSDIQGAFGPVLFVALLGAYAGVLGRWIVGKMAGEDGTITTPS